MNLQEMGIDALLDALLEAGTKRYAELDVYKANERSRPYRAEIRTRIRDAEMARIDADGYLTELRTRAQRIAELEAELARMTRKKNPTEVSS